MPPKCKLPQNLMETCNPWDSTRRNLKLKKGGNGRQVLSKDLGYCLKPSYQFSSHRFVGPDLSTRLSPIGGTTAVACLFPDVFMDYFVDFVPVFVCHFYTCFLQDPIKPSPTAHFRSPYIIYCFCYFYSYKMESPGYVLMLTIAFLWALSCCHTFLSLT